MAVNSVKKDPCKKTVGANIGTLVLGAGSLVWLSLGVLLCDFPALAQSLQSPDASGTVASGGAHRTSRDPDGLIR
jgi:hypothetical protein